MARRVPRRTRLGDEASQAVRVALSALRRVDWPRDSLLPGGVVTICSAERHWLITLGCDESDDLEITISAQPGHDIVHADEVSAARAIIKGADLDPDPDDLDEGEEGYTDQVVIRTGELAPASLSDPWAAWLSANPDGQEPSRHQVLHCREWELWFADALLDEAATLNLASPRLEPL